MDAALTDLLRADLLAAQYTVDRLRQLWGADADAALARGDRTAARRALDALDSSPPDPAATLARTFLLGEPAPAEHLAAALPNAGAAGARALGLVDSAGRALLDLRPYSAIDGSGAVEWFVVSDLGELALGGPLPPGHVLGVGGASTTLAALIPTSGVESVLDLGTGCGVQSLHASRHATRVVATDISARAIELARLTLRLNGITSVELRQGDLFDPVQGERFDRIVSNPPFVITPRRAGVPLYEYRDGGLVGDALVERVVRGVAEHLLPGGTAHLLGNWEYRDGTDGLARVREWITEAGLDGWVIERERQNPAEYAATWIRDGGTRVGTAEFERQAAEWLDDFAARGVSSVGFGYIVLRQPTESSSRVVRTERLTSPFASVPTGIGDHLLACLRSFDEAAALSDGALAGRRLVVAGDVTEERHYWPGEENPTVVRLRQGAGFARTIDADAALAGLVGASDGELTVAEIVGALADLLEVDEGALREQLLPQVRELLTVGVLSLATESRDAE